MTTTVYVDDQAKTPEETIVEVEEATEVAASEPGMMNHNETFSGNEIELNVEEMEEVIAPKLASNHNETLIKQ